MFLCTHEGTGLLMFTIEYFMTPKYGVTGSIAIALIFLLQNWCIGVIKVRTIESM